MNTPAPRHDADSKRPDAPAKPESIIPATVLNSLSDGERVVLWCQIGHLPGTDARVSITRVGSRFDAVVHTAEASPTLMLQASADAASYTIVRQEPDHVLATESHTDEATADRWLTAARAGTATSWTNDPDDFAHVKNWIVAHAPDGLFTATTSHGVGIGIASHAVRASGAEVALLTGTDVIASPRCSTSVTRLYKLIARWRYAGAPYTEQLPVALFRQSDGWRVRLVVPGTEDAR
ncbi:hypothetical protein [Myceligenerans salitolerans]|uniref:Uncharacterized protein n=1 Tax=Myceligenerans salitolerans TaxID=1230528 RepID=A0ABS3IE62_9MICO|nr:hypothetical protein [Myceligenerans salitolerans]MBO0610708.1 hypothetical protein [Myceligenerans salitolerans]